MTYDLAKLEREIEEAETDGRPVTVGTTVLSDMMADLWALRAVQNAAEKMLAALYVPGPMPPTLEGKEALMDLGFKQQAEAAIHLSAALDAARKTSGD